MKSLLFFFLVVGFNFSARLGGNIIMAQANLNEATGIQPKSSEVKKGNSYANTPWLSIRKNVLSIIPISYATVLGGHSSEDAPFGFGIVYERFFSKYISLKIPIEFGFNNSYSKIALSTKIFPNGVKDLKYAFGFSAFRYRNSVKGFCYNSYGFVESMYGRRVASGITFDQILDIWISRKFLLSFSLGPGFNVEEKIDFPIEPVYWDQSNVGYGFFSFLNIYYNCSLGYNF